VSRGFIFPVKAAEDIVVGGTSRNELQTKRSRRPFGLVIEQRAEVLKTCWVRRPAFCVTSVKDAFASVVEEAALADAGD